MLEKVFKINLFDLKNSFLPNAELDLLYFVFPVLLKRTLSQGLYREYKTFKQNDSSVRGVIAVSCHIKKNIPFVGKIAYNVREKTFENHITLLIRHTIEVIKTKPFGKSLLSNAEVKTFVKQIIEVTPNYKIQDRKKVLKQNQKLINHPYFTNYKSLQILCLQILNFKKVNFTASKKELSGILFDASYLWEEYLATLLKEKDFIHPKNKTGEKGISLYSGNPRYPDFYKGKQAKKNSTEEELKKLFEENFVLDAKYKKLNKKNSNDDFISSFNRDDVHQLITYMHIMPAKKGVLIYSIESEESNTLENQKIVKGKDQEIFGLGGTIWTIGFVIPYAENFEEFKSKMEERENQLLMRN